jgi:hypothetical protein
VQVDTLNSYGRVHGRTIQGLPLSGERYPTPTTASRGRTALEQTAQWGHCLRLISVANDQRDWGRPDLPTLRDLKSKSVDAPAFQREAGCDQGPFASEYG